MTNDTSDTVDRRRQILEAALQVFSTKGFHKATNKDIAAAAGGISPGLIYWYFKDKQDLFLSLLRERAPIFDILDHPERLMSLPPRDGLALFGCSFLQAFDSPQNVAVFRILLGEITRFPQLADVFYRAVPGRAFRLLADYLQQHMDAGALRPYDPMIAARSFLGMLLAHLLAREILRQPEARMTTDAQVVDAAVSIFLSGLAR